jgi:hypothetical protein
MTTTNGSGMLTSVIIVRYWTGYNIDCNSAYYIIVPLNYMRSEFRGQKLIKSDKTTIIKVIIIIMTIIIIKAPIFLKYSSGTI